MNTQKIYYIDLFSGAGGTTTGIHLTGNEDVKVVACVNHDTNAIESHKSNHPECIHFIEDVRDFRVVLALKKLVAKLRKEDPGCIINIWASLECTNYSKAKGGLPRDADSRTLANSLFMYLEHLKPEYLFIENVREFMAWGPLDKNGRPISLKKGRDYLVWVNKVMSFGYDFDKRILNAADYGAYTSRERYFAQFPKEGYPIAWPDPTHTKNPVNGGMFGTLKKWKPVREVLDLEDEGESIFNRKKPLVENSLKRIYAGLIKFVAGGEKEFIKRYNGGDPNEKVKSLQNPIGSLTTSGRFALVKPCFLTSHYGNGEGCHSSDKPCPTVTTKDRFQKIEAHFFTNYYSGGGQVSDTEKPCPTITGIPKRRLTSCEFMDQQYGKSKPSDINSPAGSITSNPKLNLVKAWILDTSYKNKGKSINEPSPTILASRKHHYLMNPQFKSPGGSADEPCFTLIARMDKKPPYLVETETGQGVIMVYKDDSETMVKIKEFMALYGIVDIKMRMLKIPELLRIQGFPEGYKLKGSQTEQKKYIGNAVECGMARAIADSNTRAINDRFQEVG